MISECKAYYITSRKEEISGMGEASASSFPIGKLAILLAVLQEHEWKKVVEVHSLYHAIIETIQSIGRGIVQFGDILRTVGLTFAIVRGKMSGSVEHEGEWIAVCAYGTIRAPKRGFEHEAVGFGFNHI